MYHFCISSCLLLLLLSGFDIQNCIQGVLHSSRYCCHFIVTFLIVESRQSNKCPPWLWIHQTLISSIACWDIRHFDVRCKDFFQSWRWFICKLSLILMLLVMNDLDRAVHRVLMKASVVEFIFSAVSVYRPVPDKKSELYLVFFLEIFRAAISKNNCKLPLLMICS